MYILHYPPRGYKFFFMLSLDEHEICSANIFKLLTAANSCLLNIAEHEISLLIYMKMPTFVGIFIFIS